MSEAEPAPTLPPLVVILGATAVGKTEISLELAERLNGEIISADSRLFYRGLDIGTAKPCAADRRRVPHHLIDVADPDETWSLGQFQQAAWQAINEVHTRGRLPFLVGGTGQYLRAVTQGWQGPAVQADPALRAALEKWARQVGADGLHRRLAVLDSQAAAAIDARNLRRTVRALEVIFTTGRKFSAQRGTGVMRYAVLQIGLDRPRPELYERVDARIDQMLAAGWLEEVRSILAHRASLESPAFSAIGYRELGQALEGSISLEEAVTEIKRATRVFVRRQRNWFKPDDPAIHWFQVSPGVVDRIEILVRAWRGAEGPRRLSFD